MTVEQFTDIRLLLLGHLQDSLTESDRLRLEEWASVSADNRALLERIGSNQFETDLQMHFEAKNAIRSRLQTLIPAFKNKQAITLHRVHPINTKWFRYAAAIIILLLGGVLIYLNYRHPGQLAVNETKTFAHPATISPGSNKAILTLSDGKKIELNNTTSETITDGSLSIANNNGQLNYLNSARVSNPLRGGASSRSEEGVGVTSAGTNTMTTPRGGQYQLTLSDGTRVWLNAASSITYPIAFTSKTRTVSITGEAYFEVATNKEKPFIVQTVKDAIQVLGTAFNVKAYSDEPQIKTSLAAGAIRINEKILKPGEAFINNTVVRTNIEQDIAWKNGVFNFNGMDLRAVFRQLSRWYNVGVRYEGNIPDRPIFGEMGRDLNLSQVLIALNNVGISTRLEGNTLIVYSH